MNILYITKGDHVDYQNDCLLIGLKELFGDKVVDYNKQEHNYVTYPSDKTKDLYGKGMTVSRVLPDLEVDRTDITNKIKNKFFDLVVYGSIWRCSDHIHNILNHYSNNKVIAVDGEDHVGINTVFDLGILYFKRELVYENDRILPISFGIPESKINFNKNKIKDFSYITPLDKETYIYDNEKDYYNDYSEARFGVTMKKGGWDCLRHYEIMANGCLPYFLEIENCPPKTMTTFPKELCKKISQNIKEVNSQDLYAELCNEFETHLLNNNTTRKVAEKFINDVNKFK